jgi:hypothetical protein
MADWVRPKKTFVAGSRGTSSERCMPLPRMRLQDCTMSLTLKSMYILTTRDKAGILGPVERIGVDTAT